MNNLALGLVALFMTSAAFANEYDRYTAVCRVTGNQQSISAFKTKLPYELKVKVAFGTIAGQNQTLKTTSKLVAEKSFDTRDIDQAMKVNGTAIVDSRCGARQVTVNFGSLGPVELQKMLTAMGAQNVPDLSRSNVGQAMAIGETYLGSHCTGYYGDSKTNWDSSGPTMQIHFAPELWDGLSYHINFDDCKAIYIDSNGDSHRLGH